MKRLFKYVSAHRTRVISIFSLVYPLIAALVRNALWRQVDPFFQDMHGFVSFLELIALFLGPVLAAFALLPYGLIRKLATGFLYILLMLPVAMVFQNMTYCSFNPLCERY